jgi:hypothetical protein
MKYDEIAEKYGVSTGSIAGQVHWYRKELEKEKKSRLRKRLYQKKKEMANSYVELVAPEILVQGFSSKRGRPSKQYPAVSGEGNLEELISKIFVDGSNFKKVMEAKNLQKEDLKRAAQNDIEKYNLLVSELVIRADAKDFGHETLNLVRQCIFIDTKTSVYIQKYDADYHKTMVDRANKARKARKPKEEIVKKYEKRAYNKKVKPLWSPNDKAYVNIPALKKNLTESLTESLNGEVTELVMTIDKYEKSFRKAVNLLKHLSDMSWVQRANAKPLIDAALEDLEK